MTHFLKDQIKCNAIPASTSYLLKKVKFGIKNKEKPFHQTFLFLNGETQNFPKIKGFLPNTILKNGII